MELEASEVNMYSGITNREGNVPCRIRVSRCSKDAVALAIDDGPQFTVQAGAAPTIDGVREERRLVLERQGSPERLPALLAYEARIERVREWPFDVPTLLRFLALALVAAGSWLGGALVERMLGVFLD